jgi:hypothetical protein
VEKMKIEKGFKGMEFVVNVYLFVENKNCKVL